MTVRELRAFLRLRVKSPLPDTQPPARMLLPDAYRAPGIGHNGGSPLDDDRDQFERPVWRQWNAPKASKNTQIVPAASVIESISNGPVSQLATVRRKPP
jgi:hypothetical protein